MHVNWSLTKQNTIFYEFHNHREQCIFLDYNQKHLRIFPTVFKYLQSITLHSVVFFYLNFVIIIQIRPIFIKIDEMLTDDIVDNPFRQFKRKLLFPSQRWVQSSPYVSSSFEQGLFVGLIQFLIVLPYLRALPQGRPVSWHPNWSVVVHSLESSSFSPIRSSLPKNAQILQSTEVMTPAVSFRRYSAHILVHV